MEFTQIFFACGGLNFFQFFGLYKEDFYALVWKLLLYGLDYGLDLGRVRLFDVGKKGKIHLWPAGCSQLVAGLSAAMDQGNCSVQKVGNVLFQRLYDVVLNRLVRDNFNSIHNDLSNITAVRASLVARADVAAYAAIINFWACLRSHCR